MNANELAGLLFKRWNEDDVAIPPNLDDLCAEMLLSQDSEIKKLKAKLKGCKDGALDLMTEDGKFYKQRHCKQQSKIEALKHDISQYVSMNTELATENMALRKALSAQKVDSNEKLCEVLDHMKKLIERLPAMGGGAYTCNCRCNYRPTGGYGGGITPYHIIVGGGGGGNGASASIERELGK